MNRVGLSAVAFGCLISISVMAQRVKSSGVPAGVKITEAGKVTDAKGRTQYEAEVKGKDMLFDEKGNFIKFD